MSAAYSQIVHRYLLYIYSYLPIYVCLEREREREKEIGKMLTFGESG